MWRAIRTRNRDGCTRPAESERTGAPGLEDDVPWLRYWLIAVDLGALVAALVLAVMVNPRAWVLVALVPIALAPFSYARWRLQRSLNRWLGQGMCARALAILGVCLDASMLSQAVLSRSAPPILWLQVAVVTWVGAIWFSAHTLLFLGYAVVGAVRWAGRVLDRLWRVVFRVERRAGDPPFSLARRDFLHHFAVLGPGFPFVVSVSSIPLSYDFRVERREIELPRWPTALDGLRVAHLSDIHVGGRMNRERLLQVAALTNAEKPDLVVHTGDFLTHRDVKFEAPLYEALACIAAPHGQWACLGNHDFDDPEGLVGRLAACGVTTLRAQMVTVSVAGRPLEIAGLDYQFRLARRDGRYAKLLREWEREKGVPRLLLYHDPSLFAELPDGCADLVLSGHTHGGQIGIQIDSSHAVTVVGLAGLPDQGIFRRGDMRLYVTRCVGFYGYPMRIGIPPEIALLTLRAPRSPSGDV